MTQNQDESPFEADLSLQDDPSIEYSRLELIWNVLVLQLKLIVDGLRDLALVPFSIGSVLIGLIAGGDDPGRYYRRVLRFGRRTEMWINLFGHRRHGRTADKMMAPLKDRAFGEIENNPWLKTTARKLNRGLNTVNDSVAASRNKESSNEEKND
ncbi:MAG: hypothetical protein O3A63_18495 [Proteobacteria bacterium]|nr:hypothetical protein [Pseudomonadota bacterium]